MNIIKNRTIDFNVSPDAEDLIRKVIYPVFNNNTFNIDSKT